MYSVVIVDDEKKIIDGLKKNIPWNELGVGELHAFTNPLMCMEVLPKADVLVTDVQMPELNGLELIERAKSLNPNMKVIVLSAYDDFAFVRCALKQGAEDYLLKPINKEKLLFLLESAFEHIEKERTQNVRIQDTVDLFTHNFLNKWVTASIGNSELVQRAGVIGLELNRMDYLAVVIRFLYTSNVENRLNNAINILSVCKSVLAEKCSINHYCFNNDGLDTVILFNSSGMNEKEDDLKYAVSCCINKINCVLNVDVYTCFGKTVNNYENVHDSYMAAVNAFNYCMFLKPNKIMIFDNLENFTEEVSLDSLISIPELNIYLENRDYEGYKNYLDKVFAGLEQNKNIVAADIQWLMMSILFCLSSYFTVNMCKLSYQYNISMDIYKYKDVNDIKQSLLEIYQKLLDSSDVNNEQINFSPIIKRALNYIEANYTADISLSMAAEYLNINPSYFGQLFKSETGQLFTNYINILRTKKAIKLMKSTNLKLTEIAEQIGYNNTTYFYKIFKRIVGKSPSEYKSEIR